MAVTVRGDRGAFGGALTPAQTSPLRLGALAARPASAAVLSLGANGDVVAGALVAADIPAVFTRRDVAETITASWTWAAGQTITFAAGPLQVPQPTSRSTGTRLIIEAVPASTEFALGRESDGLWTSVPNGQAVRWYQGGAERLRLGSDGHLRLNGSGLVVLAAAADGHGQIDAVGALMLSCGAGTGVTFNSGNGTILPNTGYRENLGLITRKYLSLHAAELWVETLVAQQTLATIGGRILVGPTTVLTRDVAVGDTTIYVKHNSLKLHIGSVEYGSKLMFQVAGKYECMAVTSTTTPAATGQGDYAYTVLRAWGGTANLWYAGDAAFDTGMQQAPSGAFIDLYSVQGLNPGSTAGPTIVGNVRTGQQHYDFKERWAIGQLQGIYNNGGSVFGAAFGSPDGMHLQVDSTNGIRFMGAGNGTTYGQWDMAGNLSLGFPSAGQFVFTAADGSLRNEYNGVDKMALLSDGVMYLNTGMVLGAFGGTTPYLRSAQASNWNSGRGFFFYYDAATTLSTVLVGNAASRRLQWDGASLKVISDGFTIDENGITMVQNGGTAIEAGKLIRFGTTGGYLWDTTQSPGVFAIARQTGNINISCISGSTTISGAAGPEASYFSCTPTYIEVNGQRNAGLRPPLRPAVSDSFDLGQVALRWLNIYSFRIGLGLAGPAVSYHIELGSDAAWKPNSGTWLFTSDGRTKRDVTRVDVDAALALVRQVPIVRYVYNGAFGTEEGTAGIGVVAQDIAHLMPASIAPRPDTGALTWNMHELLMLNIAAVQAVAARLDAVERTPRDS